MSSSEQSLQCGRYQWCVLPRCVCKMGMYYCALAHSDFVVGLNAASGWLQHRRCIVISHNGRCRVMAAGSGARAALRARRAAWSPAISPDAELGTCRDWVMQASASWMGPALRAVRSVFWGYGRATSALLLPASKQRIKSGEPPENRGNDYIFD